MQPPAPPALRVALPPRSIGVGPSSNSSCSSTGTRETGPTLRSRIRPRPLPSPGVEDLRLFVGSFQTSSLQRPCKGSAGTGTVGPPTRCPQRSASGTELCMRPADYHEFYPATEALRHSSASLVTGGSSTTTTSTTPLSSAAAGSVGAATGASAAAQPPTSSGGGGPLAPSGSSDVPLSPIREDLRATTATSATSASFNRRR